MATSSGKLNRASFHHQECILLDVVLGKRADYRRLFAAPAAEKFFVPRECRNAIQIEPSGSRHAHLIYMGRILNDEIDGLPLDYFEFFRAIGYLTRKPTRCFPLQDLQNQTGPQL